jgi:hypothetical protein
MIIQTIKAWLNKLFAWWPWKRASMPEYPQAASLMSKGMTQEQMWRTVLEGPMPQSGIRSVVVEHGAGPNSPESQLQSLVGDDFSERMSSPTKHDEQPTIPRPLPGVTGKDINTLPESTQMSSFEYGQQLEFLRYLVQQGVVNEGFAEGQVPMQYQSKQED